MNRKGIVPALVIPIAIAIIIVILGITGTIAFFSSTKYMLIIVGVVFIVAGIFLAGKSLEGNFTKSKAKFIGIFFILGIGLIVVAVSGVLQTEFNGSTVKYAVPLPAAIRCEVVKPGVSETNTFYSDGIWLTRSGLGGAVYDLRNIQPSIKIGTPISYIGGGFRLRYTICGAEKASPCLDRYVDLPMGKITNPVLTNPSIDLKANSMFVVVEGKKLGGSWTKVDANALGGYSRISYNYNLYGLVQYSSTGSHAIQTVCSSGCNLNCPTSAVRSVIYATPKDELLPGEAVNYVTTWVDVSQSAPQLGGTIWNSANQQFCFGGNLYSAGKLTTETGLSFIYPDQYLGKKDCCPGANIATSTETKTCTSSYTWQTVTKTTTLQCTSSVTCPNGGQAVCQNRQLSKYSCSSGKCVQSTNKQVACCVNTDCPADQTCSPSAGYICVGGGIVEPQDPSKCITDVDCPSGTYCASDGSCKTQEVIKNEEKTACLAKAGGLLGYTWVTTTSQPNIWQKIITLGTAKPTTSGYCKAAYVPYYVFGAVILISAISIFYMLKPARRRRK